MDIHVQCEWDTLKAIVVGSMDQYGYSKKECAPKKTIKDIIPRNIILEYLDKVLLDLNVNVIKPNSNKSIQTCKSLWVRDSATVIDYKLFLFPGSAHKRRNEYQTYPFNLTSTNKTIIPPLGSDMLIEGGDILQYHNLILIGLGKRTNILGIEWFKSKISKHKHVVIIPHVALHLDCCLTLLPTGKLYYSLRYIAELPDCLRNMYDCINIDTIVNGDPNLAANILFVNPDTIITTDQRKFEPFRKKLANDGYNVIEIPYGTMWRYGGGIRCLTQPILRENA